MFTIVIENVPEFYHMNNQEKLTHLLMHEWKYVSDVWMKHGQLEHKCCMIIDNIIMYWDILMMHHMVMTLS